MGIMDLLETLNAYVETLSEGATFELNALSCWKDIPRNDKLVLGRELEFAVWMGKVPGLYLSEKRIHGHRGYVKRSVNTEEAGATEEMPYADFFQGLKEYVASLDDGDIFELADVSEAWVWLNTKAKKTVGWWVHWAVNNGDIPGLVEYRGGTKSGHVRYQKVNMPAPAKADRKSAKKPAQEGAEKPIKNLAKEPAADKAAKTRPTPARVKK